MVEVAGITNILTKVLGSSNPQNVVKAAYNALERLQSREDVANRRGKEPVELRA